MKRSIRHVFFVTIFISAALIIAIGLVFVFLTNLNIFNETTETVSIVEETIDKAPQLILSGDETIKVNDINNYEEPGFSATDDMDGDITDIVETTITQKDDFNYQIQYSVQDTAGNITTKIRNIQVIIGTVCLTFDDGPSLEITPQILDILKEKGVQATFFVVGYGEDKEDIIKREYEDGHVIGFHGYSHEYSCIYTDIDTLMGNFYKIEELVSQTTGTDSKIIRFPGGASNTISKKYCEGIMSQAVQRATEEGYIYVDWNIDSNDAGSDHNNSEQIFNNVTQELKPGRTNVVLMHDSKEKQATVDALPNIIDYCIQNGYDIQTITSETEIKSSQHQPKN